MNITAANIETLALSYGFKNVFEGTYTFKGYLLNMQVNSLTNIELGINASAFSLEEIMVANGERKVKSSELQSFQSTVEMLSKKEKEAKYLADQIRQLTEKLTNANLHISQMSNYIDSCYE